MKIEIKIFDPVEFRGQLNETAEVRLMLRIYHDDCEQFTGNVLMPKRFSHLEQVDIV